MNKKLLGYLLISGPFTVAFIFACIDIGFWPAVGIFGSAIGGTFILFKGIDLISS